MALAWVVTINRVINSGLSRPSVRNFVFNNYVVLFLVMVCVVNWWQPKIALTLIVMGLISDILRRRFFFKPSNSAESYYEYNKTARLDRDQRNKMKKLFYTATLPFIVISILSCIIPVMFRYNFLDFGKIITSLYRLVIVSQFTAFFIRFYSLHTDLSNYEIHFYSMKFVSNLYFYLSMIFFIVSNAFFPQYLLNSLNNVTFDYKAKPNNTAGNRLSQLAHSYIKKNKIGGLIISVIALFMSNTSKIIAINSLQSNLSFFHIFTYFFGATFFIFSCYVYFMIFVFFIALSESPTLNDSDAIIGERSSG